MVRFGLLHLFESPAGRTEKQYMDENIELIEYADDLGLDEVWLAEHHFSSYGVMPSTQVLAGYIAGRTKHLRIGSGVVVLPFHNPVRVAEEFAFIDQLCDGRLDFGVGRGYQPAEFRAYGIPLEESRDRFSESLEIIRRAWTNEKLTFKGKYFQFEDIEVRPRPFQRPHPPIFGASFDPETIKYQGVNGMNLLFSPLLAEAERVSEYKSALAENGYDPDDFRIGGLAFVFVDEDRERAFATFEKPCMEFYRTFAQMIPAREYPEGHGYYRYLHATLSTMVEDYDAGRLSFRQIAEEGPFQHGFIVGDPDSVKGKLCKLVDDYQLTEVLCWTRLGGLQHDRVMHSMDQLVNQVVRPLRKSGALGG